MPVASMVLILIGLLTIFCAVMDFNWFMETRKVRFFVRILTRTGARILYSLLGLAFVTLGILSGLKLLK